MCFFWWFVLFYLVGFFSPPLFFPFFRWGGGGGGGVGRLFSFFNLGCMQTYDSTFICPFFLLFLVYCVVCLLLLLLVVLSFIVFFNFFLSWFCFVFVWLLGGLRPPPPPPPTVLVGCFFFLLFFWGGGWGGGKVGLYFFFSTLNCMKFSTVSALVFVCLLLDFLLYFPFSFLFVLVCGVSFFLYLFASFIKKMVIFGHFSSSFFLLFWGGGGGGGDFDFFPFLFIFLFLVRLGLVFLWGRIVFFSSLFCF